MAKQKTITKEIPTFDPSKQYVWKPEDEFILTGSEFGVLYNNIKAEVESPTPVVSIAAKMAMYDILNNMFLKAIEEEIITEQK